MSVYRVYCTVHTCVHCTQAQRVEAVRKAGDEYRAGLKERIERKLEHADEKREARLSNLQERIGKHVRISLTDCQASPLTCQYSRYSRHHVVGVA